jgi:WD40 repeat protein
VAFSPNGKGVVTASGNVKNLIWQAWDVATGARIGKPVQLRFNGLVKSAVLSDDRTRILTVFDDSDDDRGVYSTAGQVWDAATGAPIGKPLKRDYPIWSIAFSADGKRVAAAFKEKNAQVWDAVTGVPISRTVQHDRIVTSVAFSPDGRRVVTASEDKSARVWNAPPVAPNIVATACKMLGNNHTLQAFRCATASTSRTRSAGRMRPRPTRS